MKGEPDMATTIEAMPTNPHDILIAEMEGWMARGETIKVVCRYLGYTHVQLADLTGIKRPTLFNRLKGESPIAPWELSAISAAIKVPTEALWLGPEEAVRWILDHPEVVMRTGCSSTTPLVRGVK